MCGGSARVKQDRGQPIWLGGLDLYGPGNFYYQNNSYQGIPIRRQQQKIPQTGPNAIRPDAEADTVAWLACRVSTRLRPARLAS